MLLKEAVDLRGVTGEPLLRLHKGGEVADAIHVLKLCEVV